MRASLAFKTRNIVEDPLFKLHVETADQFFPKSKKNSPVYSHTGVQPQ